MRLITCRSLPLSGFLLSLDPLTDQLEVESSGFGSAFKMSDVALSAICLDPLAQLGEDPVPIVTRPWGNRQVQMPPDQAVANGRGHSPFQRVDSSSLKEVVGGRPDTGDGVIHWRTEPPLLACEATRREKGTPPRISLALPG